MPLRTLRCAIEDFEDWYPRLLLQLHIVACVAVMSRYSDSPRRSRYSVSVSRQEPEEA
jgi:hypothetical protein